MNNKLKTFLLACTALPAAALAQVTFNVDHMKKGPAVSDRLYGIFFEEINHAGDGGLYAELVRNRGFEDNAGNPDFWWAVGSASFALTTDNALNTITPRSLRVNMTGSNSGIRNEGYWGMNIVKGETYSLTFWMRSDGYKGSIRATLQNGGGTGLGATTITNDKLSTDGRWRKVSVDIKATASDDNGWLALLGTQSGTVYYDMVSLFPPTFKDRPNGCRRDLAEKLAAIHPKFLRFPGGCVVEGAGTVAVPNRFEWKKSLGPIEERPGHFNRNWGYPVTDGLGMLEYLQLAEDLGAEPLFVCNMGMGHDWEDSNVEPYIQEALDAIEYCNGDASTTWGRRRIEDGHPEPFNLRLLEVGNENYWFGPYSPRYNQFVQRISQQYPYIEFIGNAGWVGEWTLPWRAEFIDQHFYESPSWFVNSYRKYDYYDRNAPKVYVGEYAVTKNPGGYGNMNAALGEAVYMLGLERNSDVCKMASYAPIFMNEEQGGGWHPDMIRFNSGMSYGTPSYWVQQMNGENVGTRAIRWTEENNGGASSTRLGLSSWGTSVKYDNLKVTTSVGGRTVRYTNDFSSDDLSGWTGTGGNWKVVDGELCQTSTSMHGNILTLDSLTLGNDYTIELDATKVSGDEGFLIACNIQGSQDYLWWNLGGWGNSRHVVEQCIGNFKAQVGKTYDAQLSTGKQYHLKMVVSGDNLKCYIDGALIHDVAIVKPYDQKLYMSATNVEEEGLMYLKVVNPGSVSQKANFNMANGHWTDGDLVYISTPYGSDENTTGNPNYITPKKRSLSAALADHPQTFTYTVPAYSFCIFRVKYDEYVAEEDANVPDALISYSFENNGYDDSSTYKYGARYKGTVATFDDGNHAFFSSTNGYLDLTTSMARTIGGQLTGDYAVSIDLLLNDAATLAPFCWAYSLNVNTTSYLGLVNGVGGGDMYLELKKDNNVQSNIHSATSLELGKWNNVVYSQKDGVGTFYINGYVMGTMTACCQPAYFAPKAYAYIARSPFTSDAIMKNTYFDNFVIYNQALTPGNVVYLSNKTLSQSTELGTDAITAPQAASSSDATLYNVSGQRVGPNYKGLVIGRNGAKTVRS